MRSVRTNNDLMSPQKKKDSNVCKKEKKEICTPGKGTGILLFKSFFFFERIYYLFFFWKEGILFKSFF